ncbi:hypothetical protein LTR66_008220 [Elasticomyces elasticus]|nr:hypothetical protein LTR66_008220 [Elasticomyces elasticus]
MSSSEKDSKIRDLAYTQPSQNADHDRFAVAIPSTAGRSMARTPSAAPEPDPVTQSDPSTVGNEQQETPVEGQTEPSGPLASQWRVPARPRPGRRPVTDDPANKRKMQNRMAQRGYRDRRAQRVQELEQVLTDLRLEQQNRLVDVMTRASREKEREKQILHEQIEELTRRLNAAELRARKAECALNEHILGRIDAAISPGSANPQFPFGMTGSRKSSQQSSSHSAIGPTQVQWSKQSWENRFYQTDISTQARVMPKAYQKQPQRIPRLPMGYTPPYDNDFNEIDFTAKFSRPSQGSTDIDMLPDGSNLRAADPCGFCDGAVFCPCREDLERPNQTAPRLASVDNGRSFGDRALPPLVDGQTMPTFSDPASTAIGPGACADCQVDPERGRICRELASGTHFSSRPSTSSGHSGSISGMPPPQRPAERMSCTEFINAFPDRTYSLSDGVSTLFPGLQGYPSSRAGSGGFDFDAGNAARALASLSRRNTQLSRQDSNVRGEPGPGLSRQGSFRAVG